MKAQIISELDKLLDNKDLSHTNNFDDIYKVEAEYIKKIAKEIKDTHVKELEESTIQEMENGFKVLELLKKMEDPSNNLDYLKEIKDQEFVAADIKISHLLHLILRNLELKAFQTELQTAVEIFNQAKIEELLSVKSSKNYILDEVIVKNAEEVLDKLKNDPNFANQKIASIKKAVKTKVGKNN